MKALKCGAVAVSLAMAGGLFMGNVQAADSTLAAGDMLVRVRGIHVDPNEEYEAVSNVVGTKAGVDDDTVPEIDFTYMIDNHLGIEVIAGTSKHHVGGTRIIEGIGVADVKVLPPTVTVQYHFDSLFGYQKIRPYMGMGLNYTTFYDVDTDSELKAALGNNNTTVDFDDSWGMAAQIGADYHIDKNWFVNVDLKYIDIETTMTIRKSGTVFDGNTDVDLDPYIVGVGVGYRF